MCQFRWNRLANMLFLYFRRMDVLDIDFFLGLRIFYDQTNAWRWCNGSPVLVGKSESEVRGFGMKKEKEKEKRANLVTKATHASSNGLLHHL